MHKNFSRLNSSVGRPHNQRNFNKTKKLEINQDEPASFQRKTLLARRKLDTIHSNPDGEDKSFEELVKSFFPPADTKRSSNPLKRMHQNEKSEKHIVSSSTSICRKIEGTSSENKENTFTRSKRIVGKKRKHFQDPYFKPSERNNKDLQDSSLDTIVISDDEIEEIQIMGHKKSKQSIEQESKSFEEMFDLWLTPPETKSEYFQQQNEGDSFDQFINKIFSPNVTPLNKLETNNIQNKQTVTAKKKTQLNKVRNKCSSSNSQEIDFKEVINQIFSFHDTPPTTSDLSKTSNTTLNDTKFHSTLSAQQKKSLTAKNKTAVRKASEKQCNKRGVDNSQEIDFKEVINRIFPFGATTTFDHGKTLNTKLNDTLFHRQIIREDKAPKFDISKTLNTQQNNIKYRSALSSQEIIQKNETQDFNFNQSTSFDNKSWMNVQTGRSKSRFIDLENNSLPLNQRNVQNTAIVSNEKLIPNVNSNSTHGAQVEEEEFNGGDLWDCEEKCISSNSRSQRLKQEWLKKRNVSLLTNIQTSTQVVESVISKPRNFLYSLEGLLTPNNSSVQLDCSRAFTEASTQTSFDQLPTNHSISSEIDISRNCIEDNGHSSNRTLSTTYCMNVSQLKHHCLEGFTEDWVILPDGSKIFNIGKIGNPRWLQSALLSEYSTVNLKRKKVDVLETQNGISLYVNYCAKLYVEKSYDGNIKICKIKKFGTVASKAPFATPITSTKTLTLSQRKVATEIDKVCQNEEFIPEPYNPEVIDPSKIRLKIHNIFTKLYEIFEHQNQPVLTMRGVKSEWVYQSERIERNVVLQRVGGTRFLSRFYLSLYVLAKVFFLLENNTKLTKREIFYQIKHVVKSQISLNAAIDIVTKLLGVGPWHLNILNYRGLVYGDLILTWASGEILNCNSPATLIPADLEALVEVRSSASFILLVEKESIYHKIIEEDLPNKLPRPFVMITGKGMPAVSTRLFVNRISRMLSLPVFILVDADIYGIRIMLTYRCGAANQFHLKKDLALPNARWLGVFPSEITKYLMDYQTLTKKDKTLCDSLLKNIGKGYPRIVEEVKLLKSSNKKASLEGLLKTNTYLSNTYLPLKFFNQDFI